MATISDVFETSKQGGLHNTARNKQEEYRGKKVRERGSYPVQYVNCNFLLTRLNGRDQLKKMQLYVK